MSSEPVEISRRRFLRGAASGVAGGLLAPGLLLSGGGAWAGSAGAPREGDSLASKGEKLTRAALVHGKSRGGNILQALKSLEPEIRRGLAGKKRIVIKPNMVCVDRPLCATHAETLQGILEFLAPIGRELGCGPKMVIAESAAWQPTKDGFANYGYRHLEKEYPVALVDLDDEPFEVRHVIDERFFPKPVRMSSLLLDPETYIVSAAVLKTHDRVVTTLSLKNVAVGAAIKSRTGGKRFQNDKPVIHGGRRNEGIHYNLFQLSRILAPDLAIIDGFQGMEGNGPVGGSAVEHGVAVASTDWLAADRIGVELIGFDFEKVGYLQHSAKSSTWKGDLARVEVIGARVEDHIRKYRLHDNIDAQLKWNV